VRAFLPHLVQSGGYVLQVASLAALLPVPLMSAYCTSKSGVEAFAHALRAEVAHHGVRVGVCYLSWTDTDMVRGADATPGLGEFRAKLPGVFGRTYPMVPAVTRMVDGIAARRAHVYAQSWLRFVRPASGLMPGIIALGARRDVPRAEAALVAAGADASRPVGAGGVADGASRAR
jgi:short-subunit dehydrogenase